jgi:transcriptional regulator with XRE-family HTH domain
MCNNVRVRVAFKSKRAEQAKFVGEKVDYLFRNVVKPSGDEFTYEEVHQGTGISASYLHRLRKGQVANPGREKLESLSRFFGVDVEYWFQPTTYIAAADPQRPFLAVAHRKLDEGNYTPEQIQFIVHVLDYLRGQIQTREGSPPSIEDLGSDKG